MKIELLNNEEYRNKEYTFCYTSDGYLDLKRDEFSFAFVYTPFEKAKRISFNDSLLGEWLENPLLFGAKGEQSSLLGFIEISMESWNKRLRISNLLVFEGNRGLGIGRALMNKAKNYAKEMGARAIVLETQSCNIPALSFYRKNGFEIVGFDCEAYSNEDIARHEVRIEMGFNID